MHDFMQWLGSYKPKIGKLFVTEESLRPYQRDIASISVFPCRIIDERFIREVGGPVLHGERLPIIEKDGHEQPLASNSVLFLGFGLDPDPAGLFPRPELVPLFLLNETLVGWRGNIWDGSPGDFELTYEARPGCFVTGNVLGPSRSLFDREFCEVTESLLWELRDSSNEALDQ